MSDEAMTARMYQLVDLTARLDERQKQTNPDILQRNFQILQEQIDKLANGGSPPEEIMKHLKELDSNVNNLRLGMKQVNENFAVRIGTLEATLREMMPELSPNLQHGIQEIIRINSQEAEAKKSGG